MEVTRSNSPCGADRKTIERIRRNRMKDLHAQLKQILPDDEEQLSMSDQLDAAVKYIKQLQVSVERLNERKKRLTGKKRSNPITGLIPTTPTVEIHEAGSCFQVILKTDMEQKFLFHEVIRIIHEEGGEVVNATFTEIEESTVFHTIHSKVDEGMSSSCCRVDAIVSRLKNFVQRVD